MADLMEHYAEMARIGAAYGLFKGDYLMIQRPKRTGGAQIWVKIDWLEAKRATDGEHLLIVAHDKGGQRKYVHLKRILKYRAGDPGRNKRLLEKYHAKTETAKIGSGEIQG